MARAVSRRSRTGGLDPRTPVLVGAAQWARRTGRALDALTLAEEAASGALADTGAGNLARAVGCVAVVGPGARAADRPASRLASRLGLAAGVRFVDSGGGAAAHWLAARVAGDIAAGRLDAGVIVGSEAGAGTTGDVAGKRSCGAGAGARAAGFTVPAHVYALLESALAARAGRTLDEQRRWLGWLMAPYLWRPGRHSAPTPEGLSRPGPENRLVAEPYTERLVSMPATDRAAAVVLASAGAAADASVPRDRWVFPWSSAGCRDIVEPAARPDLSRAPGMAVAGRAALSAAGIGIDDVDWFDLRSRYPAAVEMAAEALGVSLGDSRGFAAASGARLAGRPAGHDAMSAIVAMAQRCRRQPSGIALTTGVGRGAADHAVSVWSGTPPPHRWRRAVTTAAQARLGASAVPVATGDEVAGAGTVAAFTVAHDPDAGPAWVRVVVTLADGRRTIAGTDDCGVAASLSGGMLVGAPVSVEPHPSGCPRFTLGRFGARG